MSGLARRWTYLLVPGAGAVVSLLAPKRFLAPRLHAASGYRQHATGGLWDARPRFRRVPARQYGLRFVEYGQRELSRDRAVRRSGDFAKRVVGRGAESFEESSHGHGRRREGARCR